MSPSNALLAVVVLAASVLAFPSREPEEFLMALQPPQVGDVPMNLQLLQNATARKAICNDGSPSGFYFRPSATNSTKWLIYLEGGGLCYDFETCSKRSAILTGSGTWPKQVTPPGIFATGSRFADFNQVLVIYCTSDLYSGNRPGEGVLKFNFYGQNVVPAVLQDLQPQLSTASEVLFCGGSAGGIGTFMNYQLVKATLAHAHVRALPDAGWFLTTVKPYSDKAVPVTEQLQKGWALWNGQPPANCAAALGSNAWQCYSGPVVYNFMPAPASDMFIQKAQTDAWTVGNDGAGKPPFNAAEIEWLMELAAQVRATFVVDKVANVFSANCLYHTAIDALWSTVTVSGTTLQAAVENWYFNNASVVLVDSCVTPLCNPSCL